jgi:poly(3-hydroxybutyrate) depolymerase/regulation of enolase protein 1 (concanavalin A-like superfamily)
MKKLILASVGVLLHLVDSLMPAHALQPDEDASAQDFQAFTYTASGTMPYRLFVPDGYDPEDEETVYPLVVFLHGAGEKGDDNTSQLNLTSPMVFLTAKNRERHPCFMVAPQTKDNWADTNRQNQLSGIVNHLVSVYHIDPNRLYITGISLGGNGTWTQASQNPNRYAAVVPVCGWGPRTGLEDVPLWTFHAANDGVVPIDGSNGTDPNVSALRAAGGNPIYTRYDTGYHNIWDVAYSTPGLVEWVMAQRKGQKPAAGPVVLPQTSARGSSLALAGTVAGGVETEHAPVTQVTWTNLANATSGTATGSTSWTSGGVSLATGTNRVRVQATAGVWSGWGGSTTFSETVTLVHAAPVGDTTAPVLAITSPTSEARWTTSGSMVTLGGTASDNAGISSVTWSNDRGGSGSVSGTSNWTVANAPLQPGANVLTVTATDAAGNTSWTKLRVWSGAPPAPLVTTGAYQIVAHNGSASLSASLWKDLLVPDAEVDMQWTKLSGPGTVTFSASGSAATSASFNKPGTYLLSVSGSSGGLVDAATAMVVVRPDPSGGSLAAAIHCGGSSNLTASDGITYVADTYYTNGEAATTWEDVTAALAGTSDPELYRRFRQSPYWLPSFSYAIPVSNGTYDVTLKFVDGNSTFISQRRFDILLEGTEVASNIDICKLVGSPVAMDLVFPVTVNDGTLNLGLNRDIGGSVLSAISVRAASNPPENAAPVVDAGEDTSVTLPASVTLEGSVSDDGLEPGEATPEIQWSKVSGPGAVSFSQPQQAETNATFSESGTYVLRLTADDGVYTAYDEVTVTVYPQAAVSGWAHQDIGSVGIAGDMEEDNGTFVVEGSGGGIGGSEDQMHFAYLETDGDCSIVARVSDLTDGHPWYARAGVMIRESLGGSGRYVTMMLTLVGTRMQWRVGPTDTWSSGTDGDSGDEAPCWVKLTRIGNVFTGYRSEDGVNWTVVDSVTLSMAAECYIGLMTCASDNNELAIATFENVTTTGTIEEEASTWLNADVGGPGATGSFSEAAGVFTVNGAGYQIWGNDQQFQFVYQSMSGNGSGDGTIIARITSHSTAHWAGLSGIMIRDSLDPEANCIFVGRDAGGAIKWHYHGYNQSWGNVTTTSPGPSTPVWLKLSREGNTFTGFYSTDGSSWYQAGTVNLTLPVETLAGMFVFSGVNGSLSTTVFDNATIIGTSPLLPGWSSVDLGSVSPAGSSYMTIDDISSIAGSGNGFAGDSDNGHFLHTEMTGDGEIAMRVASITGGTNSAAQVGLMIRDSLSSASKNALITISPDENLRFQAHLDEEDATSATTTTPGVDLPYWIKLVREEDLISGYYSQDGWNWLPAGSASIGLASTAYVGVAVSSNSNGTLTTALIDHLRQGEISTLPPASVTVMTDIASGLTLIDEINTASVAPDYVSASGTHSVTTILGKSARVISPSGTATTIAYVVGRNKSLVPGRSYVLSVEYPEDAARAMYITNRGADYVRGVAAGMAGGDAREQYTEPTIESLNYPLSGTWNSHRQFFTLMNRFQGVAGERESEDDWRPYGPDDGFHVAFTGLKYLDDPRSQGVAIGYIRLYEVTDPAALYAPIHYPPPNLPRRSVFWREEMGDMVIDQRTNADDNAFTDTLDWFQHKMRMAKVLGINTFAKDLLEFGYNQGFEAGDSSWMLDMNPPNQDLWTRLVSLATEEGFDLMPYFEYKGSLGISGQGLGWEMRAKKLYDGINSTGGSTSNYNTIWWTYGSNADLTEADTLADVKRLMDRTVGDLKMKGRFRGVWFRTRGHHLPMSFSANAIAKFNSDMSGSASQSALIDSYEGDATLYDQYVNWWFGKRRDFLVAIRDYLRNTHGQTDIDVLFTPWPGEAIPVPHTGEQAFGYTGVVTDDVSWWTTFASGLSGSWWPYHWVPEDYSEMEPLYDVALTDEPAISESWESMESFHDTPYADPVNYENVDNVYMTYPFGRLFTVESPSQLNSFHSNTGLTIVKHYTLNEDDGSGSGPFAGQLGYVSTDCDRAGNHLMLQQARAVANGDPRNIGYLAASSFSSWSPEVMRRFHQAFLAVPAIPSTVLSGASSDGEVVVRQFLTSGQGTYYYVVNTSMAQKSVTVTLPGSGTVRNLVTLTNESSNVLNLTLDSAELRAYRVGP